MKIQDFQIPVDCGVLSVDPMELAMMTDEMIAFISDHDQCSAQARDIVASLREKNRSNLLGYISDMVHSSDPVESMIGVMACSGYGQAVLDFTRDKNG